MVNRWYVNKEGRIRGPFPAGALIQDHLVGRLGDADLVSLDQAEWKPFAAWPELSEALASAAQPSGGEDNDQWAAERNLARMRWAEQRSGEDRRAVGTSTDPVEKRRQSDSDRRDRPVETVRRSKRSLGRAAGILNADVPTWILLAGLAGLVLLVGVLVYLFGAVNPVRVQIR